MDQEIQCNRHQLLLKQVKGNQELHLKNKNKVKKKEKVKENSILQKQIKKNDNYKNR